MRRLTWIGVVAACASLTACGSQQIRGTASPAETSEAASSPVSPSAADPSPTPIYTTVVGPGIHGVGYDIQPGTYADDAPVHNCIWVRYDVMGNVIQNGSIADSAQGVTVTILPTDYQFFSAGCGKWHYVD